MSGLFSSLRTASSALEVFSQALSANQRNVANISTAGFASQTVSIQSLGALGESGGDVVQLTSNASSFSDASVRAANSRASESQTHTRHLTPVNDLFDITGATGIQAALQKFASAFAHLSVSPNDSSLGALALSAAGNVASAFNTVATGLDNQRAQVDARIGDTTTQINGLASRIRDLNVRANQSSQLDAATDAELRNSLDKLSSLVDITVSRNPNGSVVVLAGGQLPLVIGDQAYKLGVDPAAAVGSQVSSSAGGNSPGAFSGQLGGLLETRNVAIGQVLGGNGVPGSLNTLAAGFASRVNTLLSGGVNSAGVSGSPIFTFDSVTPGNAARTLALDPLVTASQLGLATTGATGQANGVANHLAALPSSTQTGDQISGFPALGLFGSIAASLGQQLSDASTAASSDQTSLTLAQTNRQSESGVSLDAEAVAITAFQRAYQANAQIVTVIDKLTLTAVNLVGPTSG